MCITEEEDKAVDAFRRELAGYKRPREIRFISFVEFSREISVGTSTVVPQWGQCTLCPSPT